MSTPCYMQIMNHNPIVVNTLVTSVVPLVSQQVKLITQPQKIRSSSQKRTTHRKVIKTKIFFRAIHIFYILLLFRTPIRLLIILHAGTRAHINIYLLWGAFLRHTRKKKEFIAFSHLYGSFKYYDFFLCVSRGS